MSSSQIMLASWRGARLEVIQVLREVVDNVLKEHGTPDTVLLNRAKVRIYCSRVLFHLNVLYSGLNAHRIDL